VERGYKILRDPERVIEAEGKIFVDNAVNQCANNLTDYIKWNAGKYAPRTFGDRPLPEETPSELTIKWLSTPSDPPAAPQPPKRLEYKRAKLPGDLSDREWALLMGILEKVRARTPADAEKPPSEVLEAVGKAIDELYLQA
jgi:hypothetical protein